MMETKGYSISLDIYGCCLELTEAEMLIRASCDEANIEIMSDFYHIFPNNSFTYQIILGESHAVISTYPENKFVELDMSTCGSKSAEKIKIAIYYIIKRIKFKNIKGIEFNRGNDVNIEAKEFNYEKICEENSDH